LKTLDEGAFYGAGFIGVLIRHPVGQTFPLGLKPAIVLLRLRHG